MSNTEAPLKLKDVAEILGVTPETARKYLAAGQIRARKTSGKRGTWLITRKAVDEYLNDDYDPRAA